MMTRMNSLARAALIATAIGLSASASNAQSGPPVAKVPRDSAPALVKLASPSAPLSTVAPRAGANVRRAPTKADSAPVVAMKRVGPPADSVRPVAPRAQQLRAIATQPAPSLPAKGAASQPVAPAASVRASDTPPLGATGRCKDGTWLTAAVTQSSCADHGGLAVKLDAKQAPRQP